MAREMFWLESRRAHRRGSIEALAEIAITGSRGIVYLVRQLPDGSWTCECNDYLYRKHACKHIDRARVMLAADIEVIGGLL